MSTSTGASWTTPAAVLEGDRLAVWPAAPGAEERIWRRSEDGSFAGPELALIDELAEEALPRWNRSLRVALGRAAGAAGEEEANRRGRALVRESGVRMGEARAEILRLAGDFWNDPVRELLRAAGEVAPRLGVYNAAARHRAVLGQLLPPPGSRGPASRNIALLGLRAGRESEWEHAGALVDAMRRFLGVERWPEAQRRVAWRCLLRLPPETALQLDAAQAALLVLLPNGDPQLIVERLSGDVLRTAEELCANYGHESARRVAALLVTEACRVRVDHGELIAQAERLQELVAEIGWGALGAPPRTWGRLLRQLERVAREERDRRAAEAQLAAAAAQEERWLQRVEPYKERGYEVVELTSAAELADEGAAMRHCVGTYARRCLAGETRIFSIRRDERRVATAELREQDDAWRLVQLKGYRNSAPTRELEELGARLARRCTAAGGPAAK